MIMSKTNVELERFKETVKEAALEYQSPYISRDCINGFLDRIGIDPSGPMIKASFRVDITDFDVDDYANAYGESSLIDIIETLFGDGELFSYGNIRIEEVKNNE